MPSACSAHSPQADELQALFDAAEAPGDASNAAPRYALKVLDALPGLGPVRALLASPPPPRLTPDADAAPASKAAGDSAHAREPCSMGLAPMLCLEADAHRLRQTGWKRIAADVCLYCRDDDFRACPCWAPFHVAAASVRHLRVSHCVFYPWNLFGLMP